MESAIATSTRWPSPVEARWWRAIRMPSAAWMPATRSPARPAAREPRSLVAVGVAGAGHLDLDDPGAGVGQDLDAVRSRRVLREVEDDHVLQRPAPHVSSVAQDRSLSSQLTDAIQARRDGH